jgi:hypothetical protein
MNTSFTAVGQGREDYSRQVEPRPSRFTDPGLYAEWCERADAWAAIPKAPSREKVIETCPNCFQPRGGADWHTLWSGGFTCQTVIPHTVGDIIPDANGQKLTTEFGFYSDQVRA